jgi:hypothetical protein
MMADEAIDQTAVSGGVGNVERGQFRRGIVQGKQIAVRG